ncbi:hypothetical protein BC828DRAFT_374090 [Blastocladiella britannica]|nr:hypothetical protein BC828DRAFT_374090 [Blastocladiella britannica]
MTRQQSRADFEARHDELWTATRANLSAIISAPPGKLSPELITNFAGASQTITARLGRPPSAWSAESTATATPTNTSDSWPSNMALDRKLGEYLLFPVLHVLRTSALPSLPQSAQEHILAILLATWWRMPVHALPANASNPQLDPPHDSTAMSTLVALVQYLCTDGLSETLVVLALDATIAVLGCTAPPTPTLREFGLKDAAGELVSLRQLLATRIGALVYVRLVTALLGLAASHAWAPVRARSLTIVHHLLVHVAGDPRALAFSLPATISTVTKICREPKPNTRLVVAALDLAADVIVPALGGTDSRLEVNSSASKTPEEAWSAFMASQQQQQTSSSASLAAMSLADDPNSGDAFPIPEGFSRTQEWASTTAERIGQAMDAIVRAHPATTTPPAILLSICSLATALVMSSSCRYALATTAIPTLLKSVAAMTVSPYPDVAAAGRAAITAIMVSSETGGRGSTLFIPAFHSALADLDDITTVSDNVKATRLMQLRGCFEALASVPSTGKGDSLLLALLRDSAPRVLNRLVALLVVDRSQPLRSVVDRGFRRWQFTPFHSVEVADAAWAVIEAWSAACRLHDGDMAMFAVQDALANFQWVQHAPAATPSSTVTAPPAPLLLASTVAQDMLSPRRNNNNTNVSDDIVKDLEGLPPVMVDIVRAARLNKTTPPSSGSHLSTSSSSSVTALPDRAYACLAILAAVAAAAPSESAITCAMNVVQDSRDSLAVALALSVVAEMPRLPSYLAFSRDYLATALGCVAPTALLSAVVDDATVTTVAGESPAHVVAVACLGSVARGMLGPSATVAELVDRTSPYLADTMHRELRHAALYPRLPRMMLAVTRAIRTVVGSDTAVGNASVWLEDAVGPILDALAQCPENGALWSDFAAVLVEIVHMAHVPEVPAAELESWGTGESPRIDDNQLAGFTSASPWIKDMFGPALAAIRVPSPPPPSAGAAGPVHQDDDADSENVQHPFEEPAIPVPGQDSRSVRSLLLILTQARNLVPSASPRVRVELLRLSAAVVTKLGPGYTKRTRHLVFRIMNSLPVDPAKDFSMVQYGSVAAHAYLAEAACEFLAAVVAQSPEYAAGQVLQRYGTAILHWLGTSFAARGSAADIPPTALAVLGAIAAVEQMPAFHGTVTPAWAREAVCVLLPRIAAAWAPGARRYGRHDPRAGMMQVLSGLLASPVVGDAVWTELSVAIAAARTAGLLDPNDDDALVWDRDQPLSLVEQWVARLGRAPSDRGQWALIVRLVV